MYYKVKGNPNLVRDKNTNAILNINSIEYKNYIKATDIKEEENFKMRQIECEISTMKNDLNFIKTLQLSN